MKDNIYVTNKNNNKMIDFDKLTIPQIKELIENNICTNEEVVNFYNNEWWDQH